MKKLILFFGLILFLPLIANAFTDVSSTDRYQKAINLVQQKGIVGGYADGTFKPDSNINRAELLKIIIMSKFGPEEVDGCIAENVPANHTYAFFTDVPKEAWFAKFVCVAKMNDVIKGYADGTFGPERNITFVEGLKITAKAYEVDFTEGPVWYEDVVNKASADNLIPLTINRFDKEITRGEMADLVARFSENEKGSLDDYLGEEKSFKVDFNSLQNEKSIEKEYQAMLKPAETEKSITPAEEETLVMEGKPLEVEEETPIAEANNQITWTAVDLNTDEDLTAVYFTDADNGWITGSGPTLFRTTDGGAHWNEIDTHKNDGGFRDVFFQSPQTGYMVGTRAGVYRSTDGGDSWTEHNGGTDVALCFNYQSLDVFSGKIYAMGTSGFGYSSTNGTDWEKMSLPTTETLYDAHFITTSIGYAVGKNGRMIKTSNGSSWDVIDSGTIDDLYAVHFTSSTTGYSAGEDGAILKTTNGGSSWTEYTSNIIADLYDVYFTDSNTGWIVGNQTILKTTNAGQTWNEVSNHPTGTMTSVYFTSDSKGWAVGYNGFVIKTTSGDKFY